MPIYAYKCESCGHSLEVLQKLSDAALTDCAACGQSTMRKQVTAAGFQLKGSGWYVTDFRGGNTAAAPKADGESDAKAPAPATAEGASSTSSDSAPATAATVSTATTTAAAAAPAPSSSTPSAAAAKPATGPAAPAGKP